MPNVEAALTTARLYTQPMRRLPALALVPLLAGCSLISLDLTPRIEPLQEQTVEGHGRAKLLLLDVSGFLSDEGGAPSLVIGGPAPARVPLLVRVREELTKAAADPDVRALVVRIDSAGGTVTASDVIYQELALFKRETGRPVVAVMLDVAASGGYYVALAADTIVAHPTTVTGSIGVLMVTLSAEGLLQKLGLATTTIKSAERKDMGSPLRALTDEERKIFQSVIDSLYGQFVEKLAENRKLGLEAARKVADGRIYTARQALDLKLIDRIGYMPDAIEAAKRAVGVEEARVVVYRRPREYRATYYARAEAPAAAVQCSTLKFARSRSAANGTSITFSISSPSGRHATGSRITPTHGVMTNWVAKVSVSSSAPSGSTARRGRPTSSSDSRSAASRSEASAALTEPPGKEIWPRWVETRSLRLAKTRCGPPRSSSGTSTAARTSGPGSTTRRTRAASRSRVSVTRSSSVITT